MKTFTLTPKDIDRQWFVVDAADQVLGRLARNTLTGKRRLLYMLTLTTVTCTTQWVRV